MAFESKRVTESVGLRGNKDRGCRNDELFSREIFFKSCGGKR